MIGLPNSHEYRQRLYEPIGLTGMETLVSTPLRFFRTDAPRLFRLFLRHSFCPQFFSGIGCFRLFRHTPTAVERCRIDALQLRAFVAHDQYGGRFAGNFAFCPQLVERVFGRLEMGITPVIASAVFAEYFNQTLRFVTLVF